MEIKYYLRALSRGWWLIILTMLVALQVALVLDYLAIPIYQASVRYAISPNVAQLSNSSDIIYSLDTLDDRSVVTTYAEFLNSDRIYRETLNNLNIDPKTLENYTRTTIVITDSNVLELTVEGDDPNTTAMLANSVGQHAIDEIKQLYSAYTITLLDPAVPSPTPVRPVPLRDAGLALVLGLFVGCGLAILRVQIQTSLDSLRQQSNREKVSQALNRPYLERVLSLELVRNPNAEVAFGLVQFTGLKDIVDNLPQNLLQDLMRTITHTFKNELRGNDLISRWDEVTYAVLLPSTPENAAKRTINRICTAISQPIHLKDYGETFHLQPIMSVTTSEANETAEKVIARAQAELNRVASLETAPEAWSNPDGNRN